MTITPTCPAGTRKKDSVPEHVLWVTGVTIAQALIAASDAWAPWADILAIQLGTRLMDIDDLCSTEPDVVPPMPVTDLFWSGNWALIPQWFVDWVWGWFRSYQWSTYCECNPVPGPGSCPVIDSGVLTVTGKRADGWKKIWTYESPYGWDKFRITGTLATHSNPVGLQMSVQFTNSVGAVVGNTYLSNVVNPPSGGSAATLFLNISAGGSSTTVRHAEIWAIPFVGTSTQNTTSYTYNATWHIDFQGTCADQPIIHPPPPPPADPDNPPAGGPPPEVPDCTSLEICQRLEELKQYAMHNAWYAEDTNVHVHTHLPVDCPDCVCPPPPDVIVNPTPPPDVIVNPTPVNVFPAPCGPPRYTPSTVHDGLELEGQLAISDLVGMRVIVTQRNNQEPMLEGQPKYLWNLGWMSVLCPDGMLAEQRITRDSFVWLPAQMELATTFTWTLRPDVQITAIELEPAASSP